MILRLILVNIRILTCFSFLFLVILSNFFVIPVVKEKIRVKHAPAIIIGAPPTLTEEIIQTPSLVAGRTIKMLSM